MLRSILISISIVVLVAQILCLIPLIKNDSLVLGGFVIWGGLVVVILSQLPDILGL